MFTSGKLSDWPLSVAALSLGLLTAVPGTAKAASGAAESSAESPSELEQVVVTAQKRTERLQDVPVSITVVSGDQIAKKGIVNLTDLATAAPAVKIADGQTAFIISIRGFSSGVNPGFDQAVPTFVDGVYRGRSRSILANLLDVDQVEVLKGPQTTYFGNNAIAGAFNITSRKPVLGDETRYNINTYYGKDNEYIVDGGVSAPLGPKAAIRVAGTATGMNGYIDNSFLGTHDPRKRDYATRLSLVAEPTDFWRIEARADFSHTDDQNPVSFELLHCPSNLVPAAFNALPGNFCNNFLALHGGVVDDQLNFKSYATRSDNQGQQQEYALKNEFNHVAGGTLTSLSSYFKSDYTVFFDSLTQLPFAGFAATGTPDMLPGSALERYSYYSQELRYDRSFGELFEARVGGYYGRGNFDGQNFARFTAFGGNPPTGFEIGFRFKETTLSEFGVLTFHATSQLSADMGIRYTEVKKTAHRQVEVGVIQVPDQEVLGSTLVPYDPVTSAIVAAAFGTSPTDFVDPNRKDTATTPSFALNYKASPNQLYYFKYTQGFKSGGFEGSASTNATPTNNGRFGPEHVTAYEVGAKMQLGSQVVLNLAAFLENYKDVQESVINVIGKFIDARVLNAATSRSKGVELSAIWQPADLIRFNAEMSYLDSKYVSFPNSPCDSISIAEGIVSGTPCVLKDLSGHKRWFSPTVSGSVSAYFGTRLLGDDRILAIEPAVSFTSSYYTLSTLDPVSLQSGYAKTDLRLSYGPEDGPWSVAVIGKNLTNKATSQYYNIVLGANGSAGAIPDRERTYGIQLSYKH